MWLSLDAPRSKAILSTWDAIFESYCGTAWCGQTGDVRLSGVHPHLRAVPAKRQLLGSRQDRPEAPPRKAQRAEGGASTLAPASGRTRQTVEKCSAGLSQLPRGARNRASLDSLRQEVSKRRLCALRTRKREKIRDEKPSDHAVRRQRCDGAAGRRDVGASKLNV